MKIFLDHRVAVLAVVLLLALGLVNNANPVRAEQPTTQPRLGLALGGGSAKGFAHIGVLLWLEENHIPVNYVAGTSMGGLMGGCYAMGMSPEEIRAFVKSINWDEIFNPTPPYNVLDFRRKEDRLAYPAETEIGIRDRDIHLPRGLSAHQVGLVLSRLSLPYATISSFDELPLPFRCVAVDIKTAETVVLKDGSLVEALRATMSIPGVFTPVELEGRLLVDGGLLKNLPADVAKEMGATIVVAVDLQADPEDRLIEGIDSILMRSIGAVMVDNTRRSLAQADLVLRPELGELKSTSWTAVDQFIKIGYQAAAAQADFLKQYAVDQAAWQQYLDQRQQRRRSQLPTPTRLQIRGASPANQAAIQEKLQHHLGKILDPNALAADLTDLTGTDLYEGLRYEYLLEDGATVLVIKVIEKEYGPPFVDFAFLLEADGIRAEHVDINARLRLTYLNLWGPRSEFRFDLGGGTEAHLLAELYRPWGTSNWFFAPAAFIDQKNSSLFDSGDRIADYKLSELGLWLDLGYSFSKFSEARFGYTWEHQNSRTKVGDPLVDDLDGPLRQFHLSYLYTKASQAFLPRQGLRWEFESKWILEAPGAAAEFGQAETKLVGNLPMATADSIFLVLAAGTTWGGSAPLVQQFTLGGPFRLGTYNIDQLRGENYFLAELGYLKFIGKLPLTGKPVYLGLWLEQGGVFDTGTELNLDNDISIGVLSPTALGPVSIGASYGQGDNQVFFIQVGYYF